ncbi:NACHT domain-containing protein [Streptomyces abikoensis]|uniref:NACHT domain-containing protein n=1 Tax=Streptomyces abikoensis TaxID=97398 RepID=UPI003686CEFC
MADGQPGGDVNNIFQGTADIVIQFRDNFGEIHVHAPPSATPPERSAHALAEAVYRQWREEAKAWDVGGDRAAMAVRWAPRRRRADHAANTGGDLRGRADQLADLLTAFLTLPKRRLALLGAAGSGKTTLAVLLTMELLRRRLAGRAGDASTEGLPVPVLLSLTSWDPDREEFGAWFTRRLAEDHPGLPRIGGRHPARELWSTSGSVLLPVLDGLDEMPGARRSAAVKALNRALYDRPLIITSRTAEFDALSPETVLGHTAVIEARPVTATAAVAYLTHSAAPDASPRWEPVFTEVRERPDGPLAGALSTPLMLSLARTVYARPWSEPAELTDRVRFPSRRSVEDHLLDQFVPSVFTGEIPSQDRLDPPRRWSPSHARRHLGALARHLQAQETTELAWWRLHRTPAARLAAFPALVLLGVALSALATGLGRRVREASGGGTGLLANLVPLQISTALFAGVVTGMATQLLVRTWYADHRFGEPRRTVSLRRPVAAARSAWRHTTRLRALSATLLAVPLAAGLEVPVLHTATPGLYWLGAGCVTAAFAVAVLFTAPSDADENATTPRALLRAEHAAVTRALFVIGPLFGIASGVLHYGPDDMSMAYAAALVTWLGAAGMLILISPWSRWTLARTTLALTGQAPWALMRFLQDAHRQGVLRQVAGTYQFRNAWLQERLAISTSTGLRNRSTSLYDERLLAEDGITATSDGGWAFRLTVRRGTLAPVKAALPPAALFTLGVALRDGASEPARLCAPAALFLGLGGILSGLSWLLPRRTADLRISPHRISCLTPPKREVRFDWTHVAEVTVRRTRGRNAETGTYGIHVRLHPDAPHGLRAPRDKGAWRLVCDIGRRPVLPPAVEEALRDCAAERWVPPAFPSVPGDGPRRRETNSGNTRNDFAQWEKEFGPSGS